MIPSSRVRITRTGFVGKTKWSRKKAARFFIAQKTTNKPTCSLQKSCSDHDDIDNSIAFYQTTNVNAFETRKSTGASDHLLVKSTKKRKSVQESMPKPILSQTSWYTLPYTWRGDIKNCSCRVSGINLPAPPSRSGFQLRIVTAGGGGELKR